MSLFARIRDRFFPLDEPERDYHAAKVNTEAAVQTKRAIELMSEWDKERAEDLRRINRTGNFVEGWLVPEARKGPNRERA